MNCTRAAARCAAALLAGATLAAVCACHRGQGGEPETRVRKAGDPTISATPLAQQGAPGGGFARLLPADCGIDFSNTVSDPDVLAGGLIVQGGVAAADYDGDGDLDLYLTSIDGPNKLFRNDGGMRFTDVTAESGDGLDGAAAHGSGAYFADLNGDGRLDLYVCNRLEANQLFLGQPGGRFKAEPDALGLVSPYCSVAAAFFDADNDGDLDAYLANHGRTTGTAELDAAWDAGELGEVVPASEMPQQRPSPDGSRTDLLLPEALSEEYYVDASGLARRKPDPDQFFVNDGGAFTDKTHDAGLEALSWTWQPLAGDFNDDGLADLYISSDMETPDRLYINNGNGTFTDRAPDLLRKTPLYSRGCDIGDLNLDGRMDLFASDGGAAVSGRQGTAGRNAHATDGDMYQWRWEFLRGHPQPQQRNMLYVNRGEGWMSELAQGCGVDATDSTWSARICDLDGDGVSELLATNGELDTQLAASSADSAPGPAEALASSTDAGPSSPESGMSSPDANSSSVEESPLDPAAIEAPAPAEMHSTDDWIFTAIQPLRYSAVPNNWGLRDQAMGCGCALQDFDGDGDPDIVMNNTDAPAGVWRNDIATGSWAAIDLRQDGPNASAVGARVWADVDGRKLTQDVLLSRGFATGESGQVLLGLGAYGRIDHLAIRWPDNTVQEYSELPGGMHYTISKDQRLPAWKPAAAEPYFEQRALDWAQKEQDTQDAEFAAQPLLPFQTSSLGTGAGVADFDSDGALDIYFAGPAGEPGQLFKGDGKGGFTASDGVPADKLPGCEEAAALWFEANGDGRPDLLLTSGSCEAPLSAADYQPRLMLSGPTGLVQAPLPDWRVSTGPAAASDIDGDGDLDLVLCGQQVPGRYGAPPPSAVWRNDGQGGFIDATAELAPGIGASGPVNDAQFADMNNDGRQDLLLSVDWGSVELWTNTGGALAKTADLTGKGWWEGLGIGDFDNDGDLDLIAGNTGTNTRYHPRPGAPASLFAFDFDYNGTRDLVEAWSRDDGVLRPLAGYSEAGSTMGYMAARWPTAASFAGATLEDIYDNGLAGAERFDVDDLRSTVLLNDGTGQFSSSELPDMAQWAPAFGVAVGDFDADGKLDAFLAQNFSATRPETGRWDSGYGQLLLGNGDGSFNAVDVPASGVRIPGDSRSAVAADFNGDALLDLAVSASNGAPQLALMRADRAAGNGMLVTLAGPPANPQAVGARVTIELDSGARQIREEQAGCGYLGSNAGPLHFGIPGSAKVAKLTVLWPDGSLSEVPEASSHAITIPY